MNSSEAIKYHGWKCVLLGPRTKRPQGETWQITSDVARLSRHIKAGGNLGLLCGPENGVAVLDFDAPGSLADMSLALCPIQVWVETGSGKYHCYVKWQDNLPARMEWMGEVVGEIQRGPALQQVVMPPSIHPGTGKPYAWKIDPCQPLPELPEEWVKYFSSTMIPSYIEQVAMGHPPEDKWEGPTPEELMIWALSQPGGRRRRNGVKFQCPGCRREGHDRSRDNAIMYNDGRWGCALSDDHKKDISEAVGFLPLSRQVSRDVLGDAEDFLRELSIDDLD